MSTCDSRNLGTSSLSEILLTSADTADIKFQFGCRGRASESLSATLGSVSLLRRIGTEAGPFETSLRRPEFVQAPDAAGAERTEVPAGRGRSATRYLISVRLGLISSFSRCFSSFSPFISSEIETEGESESSDEALS